MFDFGDKVVEVYGSQRYQTIANIGQLILFKRQIDIGK